MTYGSRIAVIPAGERWSDGSIRFALEDWIGAGAIVSFLEGEKSPEAAAAAIAFQGVQPRLRSLLQQCGSGRELIDRGFEQDVALAAELNVSEGVPVLLDGAYRLSEGS